MQPKRSSPSEIHRRLVEIERERDKTRPAVVGPADLADAVEPHERLNHRCTVALSARDKLRILTAIGVRSPSDWIRDVIREKLTRIEKQDDIETHE